MNRFSDIKLKDGGFTGQELGPDMPAYDVHAIIHDEEVFVRHAEGGRAPHRFSSGFPLFLIHEAWGPVDFEDLADGYGPGMGTHGDWSGIRDSSPEAIERMLERALNHLFPLR